MVGLQACLPSSKDDKKEKSRDAARERRAKELEYFQVSLSKHIGDG